MSDPQDENHEFFGKQRLVLTHMELENFKSYKDKQVVGPFDVCFSSVVGPNGSGKSNVIDALLFVFGKRAAQLRLKKLPELIYNLDKSINSTTVSVYFKIIIDKSEMEYEDVPDTAFCISRTAYRNGTSTYRINGKEKSMAEVTELLKSHHVDLDFNRFLILQGEVEQISLMTPLALLEYLEDIIGSNRHVEQIEALGVEVEKLNEERGAQLHRVKLVEKDRESLEAPKAEAELYISKQKELCQQKSALYHIFKFDSEANAASVAEKRRELGEKLKYEQEKAAREERELADLSATYDAQHAEHKTIGEQMQSVKKDFQSFERKDVKARSDLKHAKEKAKTLAHNVKKSEAKLQEAIETLAANREEIPRFEAQREQLTAKHAAAEATCEELLAGCKDEIAALAAQLEAKQAELAPPKKQAADIQSGIDIAQSELDVIEGKHAHAQGELETAVQSLKDSKVTVKEKEKALKDARAAKAAATKRAAAVAKEREALAPEEAALAEEARVLRAKTEEGRSSMQAERARSGVLDALMKMQKTGKIPGVHGRLGDMGAIDDKYDVAISTACGALDHIVVDTSETGKRCLEVLKAKSLGRATFIILEQMEKLRSQMGRPRDVPEGVPRLFDLVRTKNEMYQTAFYYALRDTLVADTVEQGMRIAYGRKRWRVVTLEGVLLDASGTMTGGGSRVARGGMKSTLTDVIAPRELKDMEENLDRLHTAVRDARARLADLAREHDDLARTLTDLDVEISKLEMDVAALHSHIAELEGRMGNLEERTAQRADDTKRTAELAKVIKADQKKLAPFAKTVAALEAEVAEIHEALRNVGGPKLKTQRGKVETLAAEIDRVTGEITKAKVAVKTGEKNVGKYEKEIQDTKDEAEEVSQKIQEMATEFDALTEEAKKVLHHFNTLKEVYEEKSEGLKTLKTTYEKKKKLVATVKTVEVDIANQLDDYDRHVADNKKKALHWGKKIAELAQEYSEATAQALLAEEDPTDVLRVFEDAEAVESVCRADTELAITMLEEEVKKMKPNMSAIAEYRKREDDYRKRVRDLDEVTERRDGKRGEYDGLRKQRLDEFMTGFARITLKLKEMYQMITLGGDAELELVDALDPFTAGIVFSVRPPKKSWKNIANLSGGEKTLSSLALVFALHHYKPTPLYVLDEIDAALDFRNVAIIANYIKEQTKGTQFIVISLRNSMFELADRLVGIYKTENCTKSITISPHERRQPRVAVQ